MATPPSPQPLNLGINLDSPPQYLINNYPVSCHLILTGELGQRDTQEHLWEILHGRYPEVSPWRAHVGTSQETQFVRLVSH